MTEPNGQVRWAFDTALPTVEASKDGGRTWHVVGTFTGPVEELQWNKRPWPVTQTATAAAGAEG